MAEMVLAMASRTADANPQDGLTIEFPPVKAEPITPIGIGEVSVGNGFKSSSA
jgi:hypothetical protein